MSENTKLLMDEKTKTGLEILEASILLGITGDALLRSIPLGLNVFLWMTVFAAACAAIIARRRADLRESGIKWFYVPLILFSAFFAWRDSNTLMLLNTVVILATLTMISMQGQNIGVRLAGFARYAFGAVSAAIDAVFAPFFLLFGDIKWKAIPSGGRWTKHLLAVARGLAIAAPILLIFGGLFMAADAVFEGIVKNTLNISPENVVTHGFLIGFFSWTTAGLLRGALIKGGGAAAFFIGNQSDVVSIMETPLENTEATPEKVSVAHDSPIEKVIHQSDEPKAVAAKLKEATTGERKEYSFFSLGLMETSVILGLMNLLFLSFVAIQIRYFFGGAQLVQQITDLTYAEYARRGFFELVWVALLVLPILLVVEWLLRFFYCSET
jgi:lipoprotein signal peptidase